MGPISPIAIDRPRSSCAGRCLACAVRTGPPPLASQLDSLSTLSWHTGTLRRSLPATPALPSCHRRVRHLVPRITTRRPSPLIVLLAFLHPVAPYPIGQSPVRVSNSTDEPPGHQRHPLGLGLRCASLALDCVGIPLIAEISHELDDAVLQDFGIQLWSAAFRGSALTRFSQLVRQASDCILSKVSSPAYGLRYSPGAPDSDSTWHLASSRERHDGVQVEGKYDSCMPPP